MKVRIPRSCLILSAACIVCAGAEFYLQNYDAGFFATLASAAVYQWGVYVSEWMRALSVWENDLFKKTCLFTSNADNQKFIEDVRKFCKMVVDSKSNKE